MKKKKLVILLIVFFLLLNTFWVLSNNRLPYIGDDARWLQETNDLVLSFKTTGLTGFWQSWQTMFIEGTNSFPRTPLFTLLSFPAFLIFGANEKVALIMNLLVFALVSGLVYRGTRAIFRKHAHKEEIALLAVVLLNVFPGYYGMARLYMSEILQTLLVVLLVFLTWRWRKVQSVKVYLLLGLLAALGVLLRFILPIYLVVPAFVFLWGQFKNKYSVKEIAIRLGLFLLGFLPLAATWYGPNFSTYWAFTQYTSTGELAEITSLGPVWSPLTWFSYFKVIALWHWGIPLLTIVIGAFGLVSFKLKKAVFTKILANKELLYLLLTPVPALIITTLSVNKTARYFLPVEFLWLIALSYLGVWLWYSLPQFKTGLRKGLLLLIALVLAYPFLQSVAVFLPRLPGTGYLSASGPYLKTDPSQEKYDFVSEFIGLLGDEVRRGDTYLIPEQVKFNEAELVWYGTQKGLQLNSIGEFSAYSSLAEGIKKVGLAEILIIDTNPELAEKYYAKFTELKTYVLDDPNWHEVARQNFEDGSNMIILMRTPYLASAK